MKKTGSLMIIILIAFSSGLVNAQQDPSHYLYQIDMNNITLDGIFDDSEYPQTIEIESTGGQKFAEMGWGHNRTHLAVHIKIQGTGWIGLGLDNSVGSSVSMDTADIVMGNIIDGIVTLKDMHTSGTSPPTEDSDSYIDLDNYAGIEANDESSIEFIIPMSSDDTAGDDHDWSPGNIYGFFLAYHASNDDLSEYHTGHSASTLTVEIIDDIYEAEKIEQEFSVSFDQDTDTVTLETIVFLENTSIPVEGIVIEFYRKTQFGRSLINSSTTNLVGKASVTFPVNFQGNISFLSVYAGSQEIEANQATHSMDISVDTYVGYIEEEDEFNDLRDYFAEEHLIRRLTLFGFYLTIFTILYVYVTIIRDVLTLRKKGTNGSRE